MASTSGRTFEPNDLIWAKMKGFPPWPAKVLSTEPSGDIPTGRVSVVFFGTKETALMKPSELFPYYENRHQFEVPRKHKGFNEGVNEIRKAAGLKADELFNDDSNGDLKPPSPQSRRSHRSSNNSKLIASDVFLSSIDRNRNKSISLHKGPRSRTSSSASLMKSLVRNIKKRNRLDSESSAGSRKRRALVADSDQRQILEAFDHLNPLEGLEGGILEQEDDERSRRSRGSSRVFEEYMLSANRLRTRSGSEGKRSRLISGVSDVFEELFDQAQSVFSAEALMLALDNLPSEGSSGAGGERARTPEAPEKPVFHAKFCSDCGCECQPHKERWRCTSAFCLKYNGPVELTEPEPSTSTATQHQMPARKITRINPNPAPVPNPPAPIRKSSLEPPPVDNHRDDPTLGLSSPSRVKRKAIRISPPPPPIRSPPRRAVGRPLKYKVEKTPDVSENGVRKCAFCHGQVRPQMCGGSKHRWRCVDKKCRKWYGWVKSSDEIPKDIGKKALSSLDSKSTVLSQSQSQSSQSVDSSPAPAPRRVGRPPKHQGLKIRLGTKKEVEAARPKRKYTKRKDREAAAGGQADGGRGTSGTTTKRMMRELSSLTTEEASFRPSALQKKGRWWTAEKRRADYSPEREIRADPLSSAASFRLITQAMRSSAAALSNPTNEPGMVAGALDIMMDGLMGAMAPLLSLLNNVPPMSLEPPLTADLWKASAIHTPMFQ